MTVILDALFENKDVTDGHETQGRHFEVDSAQQEVDQDLDNVGLEQLDGILEVEPGQVDD